MGDGILDLDLCGRWAFAPLPPYDSWQPITVPGCWEAQGFGLDLVGPVRYRRSFVLPEAWRGHEVLLHCEAVSYACSLLLDDRVVGSHEGMWDAFTCSLGLLDPGREYLLTIEVEKQGGRFPLRSTPVGFLPDLGVTFGGLWQPLALRAYGPLRIERLRTAVDLAAATLAVHIDYTNSTERNCTGALLLTLHVPGGEEAARLVLPLDAAPGRGSASGTVPLTGLRLWSPEQPFCYTAEAELHCAGVPSDRLVRPLGLRELRAVGEALLLNGEPLLLRGILSWGYHERQLCPTPGDDEYRAELAQIKALGFNLIKHCLYVPPRRTLELCDEAGLLSWLELPLWIPRMDDALRQRLREQYPRIAAQRADHAGLVVWTLGCELNASVDAPLLADLYAAVRQALPGDPATGTQALLRDNSGSGECYGGLATDSADFYDYHFYSDAPFLPGLLDAFAASYRPRRPWLFGEFADSDTWRATPTFTPAPTATAAGLPPGWWLERDWSACPHIEQPVLPLAGQAATLNAQGLVVDHEGLRQRSYTHALLVRKLAIEQARRRREVAGYVVTVLRDQPISTAGMLDSEGRLKFDPAQFRRFNADAVLLLAWDLRRTWLSGGDRLLRRDPWSHWAGQTVRPHLVLANHSPQPLGGPLRWWLRGDDGAVVAEGTVAARSVAPGDVQEVAMIEFAAPRGATPRRLWFGVALAAGYMTNEWPLWAYQQPAWKAAAPWLGLYGAGALPAQAAGLLGAVPWGAAALRDDRVVLATAWDAPLEAWVRAGGAALLCVPTADPELPTVPCPFWREALKELVPHTAWGDWVQDEIGGLQFYSLTTDRALDPAAWREWRGVTSYEPLLRRMDARSYRALDYLAALQLGAGRLLVCTLRFEGGAGDAASELAQHAAGQALLWRLLRWLRG